MIKITNCASVGIVYRAKQPGHVLIETKTPGYPRKVFVGRGNLLGGNWVGKVKEDQSPLGTFRREIREELSFGNPVLDSEEIQVLFGTGTIASPPQIRDISPNENDREALLRVVSAICDGAKPLGAYLQVNSRDIFDVGDLRNKADGLTGLVSIFEVPLEEDVWFSLLDLQEKFGNLSNESQSTPTSVWEILERDIRIGWGQDRILMQHFLRHGIDEAIGMQLMPHITIKEWGPVAADYGTYLQALEIEKIPDGVERP